MAKAKKSSKRAKSTVKAKRRPARPGHSKRITKRGGAAGAKASGPRKSWLDAEAHKPVIDKYARSLKSFLAAMEDGRIDDSELDAQERRLVALMKEIEPQLPATLHARVTELLCELTAYDIMQMLHTMQGARPQSEFRG